MGLIEDRGWMLVLVVTVALTVGPTIFRESNVGADEKLGSGVAASQKKSANPQLNTEAEEVLQIDLKHRSTDSADALTSLCGSVVRQRVIPPKIGFEDRLLDLLAQVTDRERDPDLKTFAQHFGEHFDRRSLCKMWTHSPPVDRAEIESLCNLAKCDPPIDQTCGNIFCAWLEDGTWDALDRNNTGTTVQNTESDFSEWNIYDPRFGVAQRYWMNRKLDCAAHSESLRCYSSGGRNNFPLMPTDLFCHPGLRDAILEDPLRRSVQDEWAFLGETDLWVSDPSICDLPAQVNATLDLLFNEIQGRREYERLLMDWFANDPSIVASCTAETLRIHTLIVDIADPRQGALGLYADQTLESLVAAAASTGFVKDRFWLPWLPSASSDTPVEKDSSKDVDTPGVMLFRSAETSRPDRPFDDLLVVFLVQESPVFGPNLNDLRQVLDTADKLTSDPQTPLRMLGPFFSGSAQKLTSALGRIIKPLSRSVEVISGTATAASVAEVFEEAGIDFHRTVYSDKSLLDFLKSEVCKNQPETQFALLTEVGTGYGHAVGTGYRHEVAKKRSDPNDDLDDKSDEWDETDEDRSRCAQRPMRSAQFPFHISELRTRREQSRDAAAPMKTPTLRQTLELKLSDEKETLTDIPALSSSLTHYDIELSLRQTIQRICRDNAPTYVVTAATNIKDVIFLSEEIRKYCPRVGLATLNGDLLFTHPDLDAAMSGMVVASTYPLTRGHRGGPQYAFPGYAAEGIYNAAVAFLNEMIPSSPARFSSYSPLKGSRQQSSPQQWLTMVAAGRYWPIASQSGDDPAVYRVDRKMTCAELIDDKTADNMRSRRTSDKLGLAALVFLIAAMIHLCFTFFFKHGQWSWYGKQHCNSNPPPPLPPPTEIGPTVRRKVWKLLRPLFWTGDGPIARQADRAWYRTATFGAFALPALLAFLAAWPVIHLSRPRHIALTVIAIIVTLACILALVSALSKSFQLIKMTLKKPRAFVVFSLVSAVRIAAVVIIVGFSLALYLQWNNLFTGENAHSMETWLFATRTLEPGGMSPLGPLGYLAVGLYLWGFFGLRRIWAMELFPKFAPIRQPCREPALLSAMNRLLHISRGNLSCIEVIVAVAVVLHYFLIKPLFLATFEGAPYDRLLWFGVFLLYFATTVHFVRFSYGIRHLIVLLRRMVSLPMVDACDRVALKVSKGFGLRLGARVPTPSELTLSTQNLETLVGLAKKVAFSRISYFENLLQKPEPHLTQIRTELLELSKQLAAHEQRPNNNVFLHNLIEAVHTLYFRASNILFDTLSDIWEKRSRFPNTSSLTDKGDLLPRGDRADLPTAAYLMRALPDDVYLWMRAAEDFVMMRFVTFILQQLAMLRNQLVFAWLGAFTLVMAVTAYPLQPSRLIMVFAMFIVGTVIIGSIVAMVVLERNPVLRRLSGSDSGNFALKASFIGRLLLFVALPATVMLANVYPELGGFLFTCLEPLGRLMP